MLLPHCYPINSYFLLGFCFGFSGIIWKYTCTSLFCSVLGVLCSMKFCSWFDKIQNYFILFCWFLNQVFHWDNLQEDVLWNNVVFQHPVPLVSSFTHISPSLIQLCSQTYRQTPWHIDYTNRGTATSGEVNDDFCG